MICFRLSSALVGLCSLLCLTCGLCGSAAEAPGPQTFIVDAGQESEHEQLCFMPQKTLKYTEIFNEGYLEQYERLSFLPTKDACQCKVGCDCVGDCACEPGPLDHVQFPLREATRCGGPGM